MSEQEAMNDLDGIINELTKQYELSDIDDGSTGPQSVKDMYKIHEQDKDSSAQNKICPMLLLTEKPEYRSPAARRKFTCYISKLKGEPMRVRSACVQSAQ